MLQVIDTKTISFKEIPNIEQILATRYNQKLEDIIEWLEITSWSQSQITSEEIAKIQNNLFDLKLISEKAPVSKLIYNL